MNEPKQTNLPVNKQKLSITRIPVDAAFLGAAIVILIDGLLSQETLSVPLVISVYGLALAIPLLAWGALASHLPLSLLPWSHKLARGIGRVVFMLALGAVFFHFSQWAALIFGILTIVLSLLWMLGVLIKGVERAAATVVRDSIWIIFNE